MQQQDQFEQLLTNLMASNNEIRRQAEQMYDQGKQNRPDEVLLSLLRVGRTSQNDELRPFSIILLRRALADGLSEKSLWDKISVQTQNFIKQELLVGIEDEELYNVRSQLCDATYDLARELLGDDKDSWNELLEWILRMSNSPIWHHRQSSLIILSNICCYIVDIFSDKFHLIKNMLLSGLKDPHNMKVRLAALDAATNLIHTFTEQPARSELQTLLPGMLEVVANCLNTKDEENAQNALKLFIDLGELDSGFIKPNSGMIIDAMMKITQVKELQDSTRQLASEFLITFVENKPTFSRQIPGFISTLLNILLHMMLEMEDISLQDWNAQDENDDSLDILNSVIAQENLDRVCLALNGESIVPDIFTPIMQLINNKQDWKCRHVALMALSMIGEGCYDYILSHLEQVVTLIIPLFDDEHPRVRWAAANAAGQMSTDFGPKFQRKFHAQILPRFLKLMDDTQNPKVQAHTAAAIINFCEKFDSDTSVNYLDSLLSKLLSLMQCGNKMVTEQTLTAIASIAGCSGKHFIKYYDTFVPLLKNILNTAIHKDQRMLRAKALECISLIGIAVGKEKFMNDARQVMELLANLQNSPMDADDPQREYMLQAWTRISNCLGEDFLPYLKYVMPPLLKSAAINAGVRIQDTTIDEEEEEPGWEYIDLGDAKIAIHTSALEEKAQACNTIYCYASEMKDGFYPYVDECSKLLVPLMTFFYHDSVRLASLSTMSMLLNSTKLYEEKNTPGDRRELINLFAYIYPALLEAVKTETDTEVLVVGIEAIHECLTVMGDNCLSPNSIKELLDLVKLMIMSSQSRRNKLLKGSPDEDIDDSYTIREEIAKEDDINCELAEVVGTIVKYHRTTFFPAFQEYVPMLYTLAQKNSHPSERQLAVCIFDDIVEYTYEQSYPFFNHFIPLMLEYATDPHPGVRQAACYGLGVCAQHGGTIIKPMVLSIIDVLLKAINEPNSRTNEKMAAPTENAISSVGKIIQYQADVVGDKLMQLTGMWVSWLPLEFDEIEAKAVHQQLCYFIKTINSAIFGLGGQNLVKVLNIFARIVDTDLVSQETQQEIKRILAQMQIQLPPELLQGSLHSLSPELQQKLRNLK